MTPQPFVAGVAEDAEVLAEDRGVAFALAHNDSGQMRFEPTLVRQLLLNLITNALNVSPRGATVGLSSTVVDGVWTLALADEGPGLPPEQLPRIFERFVRFKHAQGETRGHGLGLAICRSIVELHGGTITAANRTDRSGLVVTVRLSVGA